MILSPEMGECSGYHPVSKSQFPQKVDISPLCCQPSMCAKNRRKTSRNTRDM